MNLPAVLVAIANTVYWLAVTVKAVRLTQQTGHQPNIIPREALGFILRIIWLPVVLAMMLLSWRYALISHPLPAAFSRQLIAYGGALLSLSALALTFYCWKEMGTYWRMGINPKEKTPLVTTGPFRYSAHPIYGLSMLLAIGSVIAVPTAAMLTAVCLQLILLYQEARREEKDLLRKHGEAYLVYQSNVGRFIPRWQ